MNIVLDDLDNHLVFAPLTLTRPVGNLRMGLFTNNERWQNYFPSADISHQTKGYLESKFPNRSGNETIRINACVIPTEKLVKLISKLKKGETLYVNNEFVATYLNENTKRVDESLEELIIIKKRWDLYLLNEIVLKSDFKWLLKQNKKSKKLNSSNNLIGSEEDLFIEEGALIQGATLNTLTGPIYIGKNAEIMEGSLIRGGFSLGENSVVKMGAKIYGYTSIGPFSKIGGEISNVVIHGYSNKGHDGFLGNSLIGEWCNLGADTNSSNLKNNYSTVSTYNYVGNDYCSTEVQFMGLTMGDHSKSGINVMFNTASVVGVLSNVFGSNFPPKYIPSFSWGGFNKDTYDIAKAIADVNNMMNRRGISLSQAEINILEYIKEFYSK